MSALRPHVDVAQASHYLQILYGQTTGFGSLILLGNGRRERHCFFNVEELRDDPTAVDASWEALQEVVDAGWNVYASMATFRELPDKGRGTRSYVRNIPGVWADIDVKPDIEGYPASSDDVATLLSRLPPPSLEIASGSGGRHLYWLTHQPLDGVKGAQLLVMWLDFLRDIAGFTIENVHDTTRILRVPGTTRWPKVADAVQPMPQRVTIVREGPRYHADELWTYAEASHYAARARRKEIKAQRALEKSVRNHLLTPAGVTAATYYESEFDKNQDWDTLLLRDGWTLHSDVTNTSARCRFWTRPGKAASDGKSASTDFTNELGETSRRMSIYSNDPGLRNLWENASSHDEVGICSKWQFALVRLYNGDEKRLLQDVARNHGRLA